MTKIKEYLNKLINLMKKRPAFTAISAIVIVLVFIILTTTSTGMPKLKYDGMTFEIGDRISVEKLKNKFPSAQKSSSFWSLDGYVNDTVAIEILNDDDDHRFVLTVDGWHLYSSAENASVDGIKPGDSANKVMLKYRTAIRDGYYEDNPDISYKIEVYFDQNGRQISDPDIVWKVDEMKHYNLTFYISNSKVGTIFFSETGNV